MSMLKRLWKKVVHIVAIVAAVLGFFALIELIRAYQVLDALHPWIGAGYLALLCVLLVLLIVVYVRSMLFRRAVLVPPPRQDASGYARFLVTLARRLEKNTVLSAELRQSLRTEVLSLEQALKDADLKATASATDALLESNVDPCFRALGREAEKEVQSCVRDVMIGVTISPWRAADLLVVLYRNVLMVNRIVDIYDVRPSAGSQLHILLDISRVVFTVNILNYGSKLAENLASGVPFVGRFVDDIAQGAGAGLLTSMAGHAAIERCSCLTPWDTARAQAKMGRKAKDFAGDLKGIVTEDILPRLKLRLPKDETKPEAGRIENLRSAVTNAMDQTSEAMDAFVRKPAVAAGMSVAHTGKTAAITAGRGLAAGARGVLKAGKTIGRGLKNGARQGYRLVRPHKRVK